jgi:hypothetical protein
MDRYKRRKVEKTCKTQKTLLDTKQGSYSNSLPVLA